MGERKYYQWPARSREESWLSRDGVAGFVASSRWIFLANHNRSGSIGFIGIIAFSIYPAPEEEEEKINVLWKGWATQLKLLRYRCCNGGVQETKKRKTREIRGKFREPIQRNKPLLSLENEWDAKRG